MDALSINETRSAIFCDCAAVRATDKQFLLIFRPKKVLVNCFSFQFLWG